MESKVVNDQGEVVMKRRAKVPDEEVVVTEEVLEELDFELMPGAYREDNSGSVTMAAGVKKRRRSALLWQVARVI